MIFALGAFDGYHIGHQKLLNLAFKRAEEQDLNWGVLTFDLNPQLVLKKTDLPQLFTEEEKGFLSCYFRIPTIVKIPFTAELAQMSPDDFFYFLKKQYKIKGLIVGENFRFGKDRKGTPLQLASLCRLGGCSLDVVKNLKLKETTVSSTQIRKNVLEGNMERAFCMLNYPFFISGIVIQGDKRGRQLGFPTANLSLYDDKAYPERGSYVAVTYLNNRWHNVALNIGYNTTFTKDQKLSCEAHILNFNEDLYGKTVILFLIKKYRDEIKFVDKETFKDQLKKDIKYVNEEALCFFNKNIAIFKKFEKNCFDM